MTTKRYNAGIQRAKGLLELASGLYGSSLASESWKAAEGVLQTDTPIGNALKLSLTQAERSQGDRALFHHGRRCRNQRRSPRQVFACLGQPFGPVDDGVPGERPVCQTPYDVPLHAGAVRFYRERGCLK